MFSLQKIHDAGAAWHYFTEKDDYYRSDASSAEWFGSGAERAGLNGEVDLRDFHNVLEGRIGGEQVGHAGYRMLTMADGKTKRAPNHAPGWDGTFSAPKSVSVAGLVLGDDRLVSAHDRAVRKALEVVEKHAAMTRQRGADDEYTFRGTANLAAAVFRHSSSRDLDPQLHSHAVIANATWDAERGEWVSLWTRDGLYAAQREANATYSNELAREAREMGYTVEWTVNDFNHPSFEFREIPETLRDAFSARNAKIESALAEKGLTRKTATAAQKEMASLDTRQAKQHLPARELHQRWRIVVAAHGFEHERTASEGKPVSGVERDHAADKAVDAGISHLAERNARFTQRELMLEARVMSQGKADETDLSKAIARARGNGELIDRHVKVRVPGGEWKSFPGLTTRDGECTERSMLKYAANVDRAGQHGLRPGEQARGDNTWEAIDAQIVATQEATGHELTSEHRRAVHGILSNARGLHVVQGYAGTAKTTAVLSIVSKRARAGGWEVRAMAPTSSAKTTLGDAIGAGSMTVAAVLKEHRAANEKRQLWIVDEVGMISAKDLDRLLQKADKAGARVVLVGDVKQIGSVGAGRAFGQVMDAHDDSTYRLTDIKRQQNVKLRQAVLDSIRGRANEALDKVDVVEAGREKAVERIADVYLNRVRTGNETLVVTLSRADRTEVNAEIQQARVRAGEVTHVQDVDTLVERQWTVAEQADAARYKPGDVIQANRKFKHLENGHTATVVQIENGRITVETEGGKSWAFDPKRMNGYSVLERSRSQFGEGDRIVAKGRIRAETVDGPTAINNGTRLTLRHVTGRQLEVTDEEGRAYRIDTSAGIRADLAYAQTANQAQGRTVDSVIAYMRSSQTRLADQQRAYVALSRARYDATVVTDDKVRLAQTIERNTGRKEAALEERDAKTVRRGDRIRTTEPIRAERNDGTDFEIGPGSELQVEQAGRGRITARAEGGENYTWHEGHERADAGQTRPRFHVTERARDAKQTLGKLAAHIHAAGKDKGHSAARAWRMADRERRESRFDKNTQHILRDIDKRASQRKRAIRKRHGVLSTQGWEERMRVDTQAAKARAKVEGHAIRRHAEREAKQAGRRKWNDHKQRHQVVRTQDGKVAVSHDHGRTWRREHGLKAVLDGRQAKAHVRDIEQVERQEKQWIKNGRKETASSRELATAALQSHVRESRRVLPRAQSLDWDRLAAKNGVEFDRHGHRYARDDDGWVYSEALTKRDFHMTRSAESRKVAFDNQHANRPLAGLVARWRVERTIEKGQNKELDRLTELAGVGRERVTGRASDRPDQEQERGKGGFKFER